MPYLKRINSLPLINHVSYKYTQVSDIGPSWSSCLFQLSNELGFSVVPKANLTFSKCLEMNLNDHIQTIAKVAEVAGKEYSIEQVSTMQICMSQALWKEGLMHCAK